MRYLVFYFNFSDQKLLNGGVTVVEHADLGYIITYHQSLISSSKL